MMKIAGVRAGIESQPYFDNFRYVYSIELEWIVESSDYLAALLYSEAAKHCFGLRPHRPAQHNSHNGQKRLLFFV